MWPTDKPLRVMKIPTGSRERPYTSSLEFGNACGRLSERFAPRARVIFHLVDGGCERATGGVGDPDHAKARVIFTILYANQIAAAELVIESGQQGSAYADVFRNHDLAKRGSILAQRGDLHFEVVRNASFLSAIEHQGPW